jgi:hypothetical protein
VAVAIAAIALAEMGRRHAGGTRVFPADAPLWAPVWLLERGVCAWLAVAERVLFGGVRYAGGRMKRAGSRRRPLSRTPAPAQSAVT